MEGGTRFSRSRYIVTAFFGPPGLDRGGKYDREVNTSNSGSGGPGFNSHSSRFCFLRQGTLLQFVSLYLGV